jgi:hypothetical protein
VKSIFERKLITVDRMGLLSLSLFFLAASLFCGCMHPNHPIRTPYLSPNMAGGYKEKVTGNNTYLVKFYKNGFTDPTDAYSSLLFRCLELADRNGKSYIKIKDYGRRILFVDKVYAEIELLNTPTDDFFEYSTEELHKQLKPWMQYNGLRRKTRGVK